MRRVTHHGRTTAYRVADREAEGSPLLCVHGSGGTHEVWKSQLGRLASRRPVVALDLSGHGDSEDFDADPGWETVSAYADDVLARDLYWDTLRRDVRGERRQEIKERLLARQRAFGDDLAPLVAADSDDFFGAIDSAAPRS